MLPESTRRCGKLSLDRSESAWESPAGSYGGFMTNWIITQTPRFKAAVAAASAQQLDQLLLDVALSGFDSRGVWRLSLGQLRSALAMVAAYGTSKQVQTPTLFIHGEQDNDVHITQAEEMYMALKRRGLDSVLVRYPHEGHGLREPQHPRRRVGAYPCLVRSVPEVRDQVPSDRLEALALRSLRGWALPAGTCRPPTNTL